MGKGFSRLWLRRRNTLISGGGRCKDNLEDRFVGWGSSNIAIRFWGAI